MKNIFIVCLATLLGVSGCTECNRSSFLSKGSECQRIKHLFNNLEKDNVKTIAFFGEDGNEPIDEVAVEEFRETVLYLAGCCFCKPHPLVKEWTECNQLKCIWQYLEKENVQRIAFYENVMDEDTNRPEDWPNLWAKIVEPKRISKTIKLFCKALKKERNKFANEEIVSGHYDRMQIVTDKHKFIIPIGCGSLRSKAICGIGWTSYELQEQLKKWGFSDPK
jgi:hypothetical protein